MTDHDLTVAQPPVRLVGREPRPGPARASAADSALFHGALMEIQRLTAKLAITTTALRDIQNLAVEPQGRRAWRALRAIDAVDLAAAARREPPR